MRLQVTLILIALSVTAASAGEALDVYANGSVKATLCGFEPLRHGYSVNGFIDIKEDGWFSKVRLAKMDGPLGVAIELRSSSSGLRELAIGPQVELKDKAGFTRTTYWFDENDEQVLSLWQQHKLSETVWTNGWLDVKYHGQTLGEIQVGRKISSRTDVVCEFRFGSLRTSEEVAVGVQFALR